MNREIKFKAWDNIKKEWLLGYEYKSLGGFSLFGEMMAMGEWQCILSEMIAGKFGERGEELKVMQYTGLKDKNGVEIYEGDIVRGRIDGKGMRVVWGHHAWGLEYPKQISAPGFSDWNLNEMEIIGNIYQNPELIK